MKKQDLRSQICDIKNQIHIYLQTNKSLSSSDSLQLDEKLREKIKTLKAVREIEYKLLKIAEMRQQKDLENYIKKSSSDQLLELKKENENLYLKTSNIEKENDQKIKENIDLLVFKNICTIEELAVRSFNSKGFIEELTIPKFEGLFEDKAKASDLSDYILDNPNCNIIIFCSIISSLFDADDTTKIFLQKINDNYSKFEIILPRLIHLYPDTFANESSFLYKCGFKANEDIIQKSRNEIKTSLSGSKTRFSFKNKVFQPLSSIFKDKAAFDTFIKPRNIFTSDYTVEEITNVYIFQSSLLFGMFKPDFMIRNNYKIVKPEFIKECFDIERVNEFLISDLQKMIQEEEESKVVSYLTRIKEVRENLIKNQNFFAASFISFSKIIQKIYSEAHKNYSQEIKNIIDYFDKNIIDDKASEKMDQFDKRIIPKNTPSQIDFNQGLFYYIPYSTKDSIMKDRKGDRIPIMKYFDAAVKYIGLTAPFQHPIGPKEIDINLFRDFALMAQFGR